MGPSLRDHSSFVRPSTRDRPVTRDQGEDSLVVPSRTSSLHSRITQPIPSQGNAKPTQRTPKTLTHAYMVCGVGREPSQWVKAPAPEQGKIGHMKGAVGQFWLPEILGSSPRLEQDNEIARALHSAMRVRNCFESAKLHHREAGSAKGSEADSNRPVFLMMLRFALARASLTVFTMPLSCSKIHHTPSMVLPCVSGLEPMTSALRQFVSCGRRRKPISMITPMRPTGSLTVLASFPAILFTIYWEITCVACGFTGTRLPIFSTLKRSREF